MKIQIELDERCQQTEVIIRCAQLNEEVTRMQKQHAGRNQLFQREYRVFCEAFRRALL